MATVITCDVAIVGGGLSGCLFALALADRRPDARIRLVETGPRLGGNHLWSFFADDVAAADRWLVAPLVDHEWSGYHVAFPAAARRLATRYHVIDSERLDAAVRAALPGEAVLTGRKALAASPTTVVLDHGERIEAGGVIDCRGAGDLSRLILGWRKFLGRELLLERPHDLAEPIVADATVEQVDGYRFVTALPLAPTRLFVEDSCYSDRRPVDRRALAARIDAHARARGWRVAGVGREESGSLPVVIGGDFAGYWRSGGNRVAKGGVRAGLFHPLTCHALPDAVRAAVLVADARDLRGAALHDLLHHHARALWRRRRFYRVLAAMLFRATAPGERWRLAARLYALDEALIARFHAGGSPIGDKARMLAAAPPAALPHMLAALRGAW